MSQKRIILQTIIFSKKHLTIFFVRWVLIISYQVWLVEKSVTIVCVLWKREGSVCWLCACFMLMLVCRPEARIEGSNSASLVPWCLPSAYSDFWRYLWNVDGEEIYWFPLKWLVTCRYAVKEENFIFKIWLWLIRSTIPSLLSN